MSDTYGHVLYNVRRNPALYIVHSMLKIATSKTQDNLTTAVEASY